MSAVRILGMALLLSSPITSWAKDIVICFDGTGQDGTQIVKPPADDASETVTLDTARAIGTNVWILCGENGLIGDAAKTKYFPGVGSKNFLWFDEKGELTGWGAASIRRKAVDFVDKNYNSSLDKLFVFGYSRGAAIARDFVNAAEIREVEFLGLWDTVGAFGIPTNFFGNDERIINAQKINLFKRLEVPSEKVSYTVHAVAIDEKREPFYPTLVKAAPNVDEVWFIGVHSDIGGGNPERGLSNITLNYVVEKAIDAGLDVSKARLANYPPDPLVDIHKNKKMKERARIIQRAVLCLLTICFMICRA